MAAATNSLMNIHGVNTMLSVTLVVRYSYHILFSTHPPPPVHRHNTVPQQPWEIVAKGGSPVLATYCNPSGKKVFSIIITII